MNIPARALVFVAAALIALMTACAPSTESTAPAAATSYLEFREGFCSAFDDLFKAIGNPDAGTDSELMKRLDEAVTRGDLLAADLAARDITAKLESARARARFAGGWAPASAVVAPMDALFAAFEASTEAKRASAAAGTDVAERAAQRAFEQAGGVDAWTNMFRSFQDPDVMAAIAASRPPGMDPQCPTVPISV
jgi:hypothetical protein